MLQALRRWNRAPKLYIRLMWHIAECDDRRMSARERLHAAIAYGRPNGNIDPDTDPGAGPQSLGPPLIVVD